jgi:tRNA(fMet)-specific endonuclease VapC
MERLPRSRRRDKLEAYFAEIGLLLRDILPYDRRATIEHARQTARLERIGLTPGLLDAQIAAVAVVNDATLVTRNVDDFQHFTGLRIENWHAA